MKRIVPFSLDSFHIFLLGSHISANQNQTRRDQILSRADNLQELLLSCWLFDWLRRRQISHVLML